MTTEHPQRFGALRVVVQKDVAFLAFDQGEHVDVVVHDLDSIHSGRGAGEWPTLAGLVGAGQVVSRLVTETSVVTVHDSTLPVSSAIRPLPHHSGFSSAAARREHLTDVHVTAEPDKVVAALQVVLPAAEAGIVAEVIVAGERLGEFAIVTAINT